MNPVRPTPTPGCMPAGGRPRGRRRGRPGRLPRLSPASAHDHRDADSPPEEVTGQGDPRDDQDGEVPGQPRARFVPIVGLARPEGPAPRPARRCPRERPCGAARPAVPRGRRRGCPLRERDGPRGMLLRGGLRSPSPRGRGGGLKGCAWTSTCSRSRPGSSGRRRESRTGGSAARTAETSRIATTPRRQAVCPRTTAAPARFSRCSRRAPRPPARVTR